jgi:hypothetical protein
VHFQNPELQNHFELLSNPLQKKEPPTQRQSMCGEAPTNCFSQEKNGGKGGYGLERKEINNNKK